MVDEREIVKAFCEYYGIKHWVRHNRIDLVQPESVYSFKYGWFGFSPTGYEEFKEEFLRRIEKLEKKL